MKIIVEVVPARVMGDELRYAIRTAPQAKTGDPMATARGEVAAYFPDLPLKKAIVHSTSWRYDDDTIVLTFLVYSDELPRDGLPLTMPLSAVEQHAKEKKGKASVAAHALRHLAFLVQTEPREFVPKIRPDPLARIRTVSPDISRNRTPEAA